MGEEVCLTASAYDWQDGEKSLRERLRIRSKYVERNQERKIQMYIKALEYVRESELKVAKSSKVSTSSDRGLMVTVKIWVNYSTKVGDKSIDHRVLVWKSCIYNRKCVGTRLLGSRFSETNELDGWE